MNDLKEQISKYEDQKETLEFYENEITELKGQENKYKEEKETYEKKIVELKEQINKFKEEEIEYQKMIDESKASNGKNEIIQNEYESLKSEKLKLEIQVDEIEKSLTNEIKKLNSEKAILEEEVNKSKKLSEKYQSIELSNKELISNIESLKQNIKELEDKIKQLEEQNEINNVENENQCNKLKEEKSKLEDEIKNILVQNNNGEHINNTIDNESQNEKEKKLLAQISSLTKSNSDLKFKLRKSENQCIKLQQTINSIKSESMKLEFDNIESFNLKIIPSFQLQIPEVPNEDADLRFIYIKTSLINFFSKDNNSRRAMIPVLMNFVGCNEEQIRVAVDGWESTHFSLFSSIGRCQGLNFN